MIELLLQADRTLTMGLVDQAERLYRQAAEADPLNAMAVTGLARVAVERGDDRGAWQLAVRALELDPEDATAIRLEARCAEILAARGEPVKRPDWVIANEAAWRHKATADLSARAASMPRPAPPRAVYPAAAGTGAAAADRGADAAADVDLAAATADRGPHAPATTDVEVAASADATTEAPDVPPPSRRRGLLARLFGR